MTVEIVRELSGWAGDAVLVRAGDEHFVVSTVGSPLPRPETLVFDSTEDGQIADYAVFAGGPGMSREEAIADLQRALTARAKEARDA